MENNNAKCLSLLYLKLCSHLKVSNQSSKVDSVNMFYLQDKEEPGKTEDDSENKEKYQRSSSTDTSGSQYTEYVCVWVCACLSLCICYITQMCLCVFAILPPLGFNMFSIQAPDSLKYCTIPAYFTTDYLLVINELLSGSVT